MRGWSNALRLHITSDPRAVPPSPAGMSRLEQLEAVRALRRSESCRRAVALTKSWHLPPAADWVRATAYGCRDPEFGQLSAISLRLQTDDAAKLIDAPVGSLDATMARLREASLENTHQPAPPRSVVPRYVRADAGVRYVFSAFGLLVQQALRLATTEHPKLLSMATASLTEGLPQAPLFEMTFESASQADRWRPSGPLCQRFVRLITDRPDLLTRQWWGQARHCQQDPALRFFPASVVAYGESTVVAGTGLIGSSPWQQGLSLAHGIGEAANHAPWDEDLAEQALRKAYDDDPPAAALKQAYAKIVDYDVDAMARVIIGLHGADDDEVQRLAEIICARNVEHCAVYAEYLAGLGREAAAEKMWTRALREAQDQIALSNSLGTYVNVLLDRGETDAALRVARRAADVYSANGLFTLAFALERLGREDEAAREYAKITRRYGDALLENAFYIRQRQRDGGERFAGQTRLAMAAVFPDGLRRKALADFRRDQYRGGVMMGRGELTESLRRAGVLPMDMVVAVDGFEVRNKEQFQTVLTFTDDPRIHMVVMRQGSPGWVEIAGTYRRWKYGPVTVAAR
jgi:tetratricopeptide (TPR) repeat protein